jgi:hypothetical protein
LMMWFEQRLGMVEMVQTVRVCCCSNLLSIES